MQDGIREYVNSGQYFLDARKWYYHKYITPISHRSIFLVLISLGILILVTVAININVLLPITKQLKYAIFITDGTDKSASVHNANSVKNDPLRSILKIMIQDYVLQREKYNYENLERQIKYVHKRSNRVSFNNFYNYLNIDNPNSPVLRYQQEARRFITIKQVDFIDDYSAEVHFLSKAIDNKGNTFEDLSWIVLLNFDSGNINLNLPNGTDFRFIVTDYKLKLVGDNNAHK